MKVSLASALGTCFGVEDAINLALEPQFKGELTIVGQLVHNSQVNESLKKNGVSVVSGIDKIDQIKTKKVMITAHGAADKMKEKLTEAGLIVYDASCPLVMRVHKTIKSMVEKDYYPVVIGQDEHVEVKGIVGDLDAIPKSWFRCATNATWKPIISRPTRSWKSNGSLIKNISASPREPARRSTLSIKCIRRSSTLPRNWTPGKRNRFIRVERAGPEGIKRRV